MWLLSLYQVTLSGSVHILGICGHLFMGWSFGAAPPPTSVISEVIGVCLAPMTADGGGEHFVIFAVH